MSDSILFYLDRSESLQVIDPDTLSHSDDLTPLTHIILAVVNAGYGGVIMDEERLANGRYFQALNVNLDTPEGNVIKDLQGVPENALPTPQAVIEIIRGLHEQYGL